MNAAPDLIRGLLAGREVPDQVRDCDAKELI
jgi:hypothetical protein